MRVMEGGTGGGKELELKHTVGTRQVGGLCSDGLMLTLWEHREPEPLVSSEENGLTEPLVG